MYLIDLTSQMSNNYLFANILFRNYSEIIEYLNSSDNWSLTQII